MYVYILYLNSYLINHYFSFSSLDKNKTCNIFLLWLDNKISMYILINIFINTTYIYCYEEN